MAETRPGWLPTNLKPTPSYFMLWEDLRSEHDRVGIGYFRARMTRYRILFENEALLAAERDHFARPKNKPNEDEHGPYQLYREDYNRYLEPYKKLIVADSYEEIETILRQQPFFTNR